MKTQSILVLLIYFSQNVLAQHFVKSESYNLTKVRRIDTELLEDKDVDNAVIYLEDSTHKKITTFKITTDAFDREYSIIHEMKSPSLLSVKRIVKARIVHCACYCNDDIYYWLITKQNKWIALPKIEQDNYEIGNVYTEYIFPKNSKDTIELVEFKENINIESPNAENPSGYDIERIYQKTIKVIKWDGNKLMLNQKR